MVEGDTRPLARGTQNFPMGRQVLLMCAHSLLCGLVLADDQRLKAGCRLRAQSREAAIKSFGIITIPE